MFWPDEIRAADFDTIHEDGKVRDQELDMARALIANLTEPWNPQAYHDGYREALLEVVEKKVAGEEIQVAAEAAPARVVDLMEALKASVEAVKTKSTTTSPKKSPSSSGAKKSTAKKSTAKKSTTKTTTTERKKAAAG
jgi:DNA end-binding protein Ku